MALTETLVYEQGDKVYLVAPVTPRDLSDEEVANFDFIEQLRKQAPNDHIAWFAGHYVEADNPNGNGAMWTAGELAIKSLTPMLMPITVMHDPRTAVGLIAHTALRTPDKDDVPRSKIDTALAVWKHRFPEVVEEAQINYRQGTLMQSMECLAPAYDCADCGMGFVKLPQGAERANWCAHLKGDAGVTPTRILRGVTFTGTGLIFGTRGARGADPQAHLETFQQEVAEFHERVHRGFTPRPRRQRIMPTIEIEKSEYDELLKRPTREELDAEKARADEAVKDQEKLEADKVKAEQERDAAKTELAKLEETARETQLRDDRLGSLGAGFLAALGDKTRDRLKAQAAKLADEEWTARLEELEELTDKKRDDGATTAASSSGSTFTPEEVARFQAPAPDSTTNDKPQDSVRRSVLAGLTSN